ncbi:hypothetical protein ACFLQ3_00440 [Bacteroidota bacterium]
MILIADSGSTNTDWVIVNHDKIIDSFTTIGFNPYFTNGEEINNELETKFPENIKVTEISNIYFYGSGCSNSQNNKVIHDALIKFFNYSLIEVYHDLLAAARALFMNDSGITVILGTGANTGFYDGLNIKENIPSLGYILGDEGGGDYLGKLFITELLYGNIPEEIDQDFRKRYELSNQQILHKIYKEPSPNRFLASFCEFIIEHKNEKFINSLVLKSFADLFDKHVTKYDNYKDVKIGIVGSIGFYFQSHLKDVAKQYNIDINLIEKSPINGLTQYHIQNK